MAEPLTITQDHHILAGYARWKVGRRWGETTLPCFQLDLTEEEAILWIIQKHRQSNGLHAFSRILLALELEPWFREQAQANQSIGGRDKVRSKLTEDRRFNCRGQIAKVAGVSAGNVTKVKQLRCSAAPQLLDALRADEVSIHHAWKLSKLSVEKQLDALGRERIKKHTNERIQKLLSKHISKSDPAAAYLRHLIAGLTGLKTIPCLSCIWEQIDALLTAIEYEFHHKRSNTNAEQADPQTDPG